MKATYVRAAIASGEPGLQAWADAQESKLAAADEKVRVVALKAMGGAYEKYSAPVRWEGGQDLTGHRTETLGRLAEALSGVPGGYDMLYEVSKKQFPRFGFV